MTAELPADFSINGRYSKSETARILGISRTSLDKYIRQGDIAVDYSPKKDKFFIKGKAIVKYFNS